MSEQPKYAKCSCESCGGHIEYPIELGGSTIECPHCRFSTPLPSLTKPKASRPPAGPLVAVGMLVLVAAIGYATWQTHFRSDTPAPVVSEQPQPKIAPASPPPVASPTPVVQQWDGLCGGPVAVEKVGEGNLVYAVGVLTNTSGQQKFGVKVHIDLFDDTGSKIGSATDYANSIDPGKAWQYRALVVEHGAVKAEIKDVTED